MSILQKVRVTAAEVEIFCISGGLLLAPCTLCRTIPDSQEASDPGLEESEKMLLKEFYTFFVDAIQNLLIT